MRIPVTSNRAIQRILIKAKPKTVNSNPFSRPSHRSFSNPSSPAAKMTTATPFKIQVTPENTGLWKTKQTEDAAKKVSELLQQDLETHHVFFNDSGFHNHIPHHLLALYGTGAPAPALSAAYAKNATYQRPVLPEHTAPTPVLDALRSSFPENAPNYLGKEQYYPDFLRFFQLEIEAAGGWAPVLTKYLLAGTPAADDLLVRLFAGFLHPLIQLMYGVEWDQPAIVAEALAQTAVHGDNGDDGGLGKFLLGAEAAAAAAGGGGGEGIVELLEAVRGDEKVAGAARMGDMNKVRDGVLARARGEMVALAARVRVGEGEVEERTAEMLDACLYAAAAAALGGKGKAARFDFFLIHHVNAAPIFLTFNKQSWIPRATKARLLEWKIRMDLLQYAARGCPVLDMEKIKGYQPKSSTIGGGLEPISIISRLHTFPDDGHAIKLGRAALLCQETCRAYQGTPVWDRFMIKGDDVWEKVHSLIVDSVEAPGPNWVRSTGFEEAWKDIPNA